MFIQYTYTTHGILLWTSPFCRKIIHVGFRSSTAKKVRSFLLDSGTLDETFLRSSGGCVVKLFIEKIVYADVLTVF